MSSDSVDGGIHEITEDCKPALIQGDDDIARKRRQRSHSSSEPLEHVGHVPTPSDSASSSSHPAGGEDHLTLRRREANRLAAQRFRSRKKGYQDSLEEKVRQLEDDKELLVRRLTEGPVREYKPHVQEAIIDVDVRVAALESANRKLQEELKFVGEENDRLREEVDQWRRWEREQREASRAMRERVSGAEVYADDKASRLPDFSVRSQSGARLPPTSFPSAEATSPTLPSPLAPSTPGFRLPPIRLPPIHMAHSVDAVLVAPQYLSRPSELSGFGLGSRPTASPR